MIAIIKTGGKQYKVALGQKIQIEKLDAKENEGVVFDEVLLIENNGKVEVGQPTVKGAKAEGKIIKQGREDKVIIFKYKSKKRFHKKQGHRQPYTMVEITKISF